VVQKKQELEEYLYNINMAILKLNNNSLTSVTELPSGVGSDPNTKVSLARLGLRVFANQNLATSNTQNLSYDVFQDSTGIQNLTNAVRSSSEFMSSVSITQGAPSTTADDLIVLDSYGHSDEEDNFVDLSTGGEGETSISHAGVIKYDNGASLTGSNVSIYSGGASGDYIYNTNANTPSTNRFQTLPSLTNYTIELWVYPLSSVNYGTNSDSLLDIGQILQFEFDSSENLYIYNAGNSSAHANLGTLTKDAWNHVAYVKEGSTFYAYKNGVQMGTGTAYSTNFTDSYWRLMYHRSATNRNYNGYVDLFRITKRAVYPSGTTFTPLDVWSYNQQSVNATGSFEGVDVTAPSSVSKMGAVITYEETGTNVLNTDIVMKLSADSGSNFTTATLEALPDFASGVKCAKISDVSVTPGTACTYQLNFANQSDGVKIAKITGVSLTF
tara:strand:- start:255 stop:1577 length:1323 start_codon:yes stop_codon:yes gene_type:complete